MDTVELREHMLTLANASQRVAATVAARIDPEDKALANQVASELGGWDKVATHWPEFLALAARAETAGQEAFLLGITAMVRALGYELRQ